jgi:hypothetical protein
MKSVAYISINENNATTTKTWIVDGKEFNFLF